jgi:hypothetical protein
VCLRQVARRHRVKAFRWDQHVNPRSLPWSRFDVNRSSQRAETFPHAHEPEAALPLQTADVEPSSGVFNREMDAV